MARARGTFTVIAFIVLTAVSIAAAAQAVYLGIPESLASSVSVLITLLSTEDMSHEPRAAKLKLGQRAQRELYDNVDCQPRSSHCPKVNVSGWSRMSLNWPRN